MRSLLVRNDLLGSRFQIEVSSVPRFKNKIKESFIQDKDSVVILRFLLDTSRVNDASKIRHLLSPREKIASYFKNMRPIFCGNLDYDARQSELERMFGRYGRVDRVDMKSGFAFVYMEDERDARDAIRGLDRTEFGRKRRRLRVEWTKQESGIRRPGGGSGRSSVNMRPTKTLFVINFDPINTRTRDLERHFDSYGKILNIRIRRNFAFIQYEHQEDATKALDATNMSKMMDRVISVEYAIRDDDEDERRNGYSPDRRGRDRSPEKRNRDHRRSPNPYGRVAERGSPDYGRGPSPYDRHQRGSPDYGRERRDPRDSPDYGRERRNSRDSTEYGRGRREQHSSDFDKERHPQSQSPDYEKEGRERQRSQDYGRESREHHSPDYGRDRREQQNSPDYGEERHNQGHSPDYGREEDPDYDEKYRSRSRSRTPPRRENM